MTQAQENSYDKAVNAWNDAQVRYGQAQPYIKKAVASCLAGAVWLGIVFFLRSRGIPQDCLPEPTERMIKLSQHVINTCSDSTVKKVIIVPVTSALYQFAKDPQDGKKIVEQASKVLKDCVMGSVNVVQSVYYWAKYVVTKYSEYYFTKYPVYASYTGLYFKCSESEIPEDIQSDQSLKLNGEEPSLQTSE